MKLRKIFNMSDIKTVWEGQYLKVDLVDTTTVMEITDNYKNRSRMYSLTEMMDLHQELVEAFDVTIKELKKSVPDLVLDVYTEGQVTVVLIPHGRIKIMPDHRKP